MSAKGHRITIKWSKMTPVQRKLYIEYGCHEGASYIIDHSHSDVAIRIAPSSSRKLEDYFPIYASTRNGKLLLTSAYAGPSCRMLSAAQQQRILDALCKSDAELAKILEKHDVTLEVIGPKDVIAAFQTSSAKHFRSAAMRWCSLNDTTMEVL